jgi:hypothetical protein
MSVIYIKENQEFNINDLIELLGTNLIIYIHENKMYESMEHKMYRLGIPYIILTKNKPTESVLENRGSSGPSVNYVYDNYELEEVTNENYYEQLLKKLTKDLIDTTIEITTGFQRNNSHTSLSDRKIKPNNNNINNNSTNKLIKNIEKEAKKIAKANDREEYRIGMRNFSSSKKSIEKTLKTTNKKVLKGMK